MFIVARAEERVETARHGWLEIALPTKRKLNPWLTGCIRQVDALEKPSMWVQYGTLSNLDRVCLKLQIRLSLLAALPVLPLAVLRALALQVLDPQVSRLSLASALLSA